MRYGVEHKQRTRERVLKAAARLIRADGPHQLAVAEVMAGAGLTHGGFYAHFASKDELIAKTIAAMFAEGAERMGQATDGRGPVEALGRYIDLYLSTAHRDARTGGCPIPFLAADLPRLTEAARASFAAGVTAMRTRLAAQLRALGRAQPDCEASSMLAELVGALSLARAEPDPKLSDAILDRSRAALKRRLGLET